MDSLSQAENSASKNTYPIRVLAEKTGVGSSTLRAWERRYGLLKPLRTPKGHRLYSDADIAQVGKILRWLEDGHSFKTINARLAGQMQTHPLQSVDEKPGAHPSVWQQYVQTSLEAIDDFSLERIDAVFNEAASLYPLEMVTERLVFPVLKNVGDRWQNEPNLGVAQEHFYISWLKAKLSARFLHAYSNARGARVVCACMPGCFHEIGLLLFALSALSRGYRILYFGANLPLAQLSSVVERSAAKALVLSAQGEIEKNVPDGFRQLLKHLDKPVFIGGSAEKANLEKFEQAGGILLGTQIPVALHILEGYLPAHNMKD